MATIFTRIIEGDIPSYKIDETKDFYAFLDINPLQKGHTLIIPKVEIDYVFDLSDNYLENYLKYAKKISSAIEKAIPCKRIGLSVIGLEVPHAHLHLIPISQMGDMNFSKPKLNLEADEMKLIAQRIISFL